MNCYFYINIDVKKNSYKEKWLNQLSTGIIKYSKKLKITNDIEQADIIFTIKDFVDSINLKEKQILVILSCQDNAICDSRTINNKKIKYIFEHTKLSGNPIEIITIDDNVMKYLLKFDKKITTEIYDNYDSKVIPILNTSFLYRRIYKEKISLLKDRKYDIVFTGLTNYDDKMVSKHRLEIIDKIIEFANKYSYTYFVNESRINIKQYYELLEQTKIFISPYGYGEFSLKDFECICFGCHVIKPKIYFEYYPNFCKNFDDFELDLSNFDSQVNFALRNIDTITQTKVNNNRKLFEDYHPANQIEFLDSLFS